MLAGTFIVERGISELIFIMAYFLCKMSFFSNSRHFIKTNTEKFSLYNQDLSVIVDLKFIKI